MRDARFMPHGPVLLPHPWLYSSSRTSRINAEIRISLAAWKPEQEKEAPPCGPAVAGLRGEDGADAGEGEVGSEVGWLSSSQPQPCLFPV